MDTEIEATFPNIDKADVRNRLRSAGAKLIRPEFLQRKAPLPSSRGIR